jgi:ABC-type branched-subunit amino acid transport system substrate-binding protein
MRVLYNHLSESHIKLNLGDINMDCSIHGLVHKFQGLARSLAAIGLTLSILFLMLYPCALFAQSTPIHIISWSSPVGSQAITFETLYGLKALSNFVNANGGVDNREIVLQSLDMDDTSSDFNQKLDALVIQAQPDLVVGGAANSRAANTAEYFRRIAIPWFGPWTDDPRFYENRDDDPVGLLPSAPAELDMIFKYIKKHIKAEQQIFFIYTSGLKGSDTLTSLTRAKARSHELELNFMPLPVDFSNWRQVVNELKDQSYIILWTNPGPSAAIKRMAGNSLPNTVWLTNSLNTPDHEIVHMAAGTWTGMIFPSVLIPSAEISDAYSMVLGKYGLPGLHADYQTFLGFGQGQILARALTNANLDKSNPSISAKITRTFKDVPLSGTILSGDKLPYNADDPGGSYLARVLQKGAWGPVE